MNRLLNRIHNKLNRTYGETRFRLSPKKDSVNPLLIHNRFHIGEGAAEIRFRTNNEGDWGAIYQVFHCQDYRVDIWTQGKALARYYASQKKNSKLLIIDAGANIGAASVYFNTAYPDCKIVAIEPEKTNCTMARLNCARKEIEIIEGALGEAPGTLFLQDPGLSNWGFRVGKEGEYEVKVFTIDQILSNNHSSTIPFILKIDIEGSEQNLFTGNCDWIDQFALVIVETHDWMLPGQGSSRNFYQEVCKRDFDILQRGENTFCFNNLLLRDYY
jgi:FkbM family methyltransferase